MTSRHLRGAKRKLRNIEKQLINRTTDFPSNFYYGVHGIKLPANQDFVNGLNSKGKKKITQFLMATATSLIEKKLNPSYKVVILLFPNNFWRSEIIIFENDFIFKDFFHRTNPWQVWREVKKKEYQKLANINWDIKVYEETIQEDDWLEENIIICLIER